MADIVILGEGEQIFVELADKIVRDKGSSLEEKQGIAFINENGELYNKNAHLLRIENLDDLPFPDRSLLPKHSSGRKHIEREFGITIVNKRISITPIALIGGAACKCPEDFVTIDRKSVV